MFEGEAYTAEALLEAVLNRALMELIPGPAPSSMMPLPPSWTRTHGSMLTLILYHP